MYTDIFVKYAHILLEKIFETNNVRQTNIKGKANTLSGCDKAAEAEEQFVFELSGSHRTEYSALKRETAGGKTKVVPRAVKGKHFADDKAEAC